MKATNDLSGAGAALQDIPTALLSKITHSFKLIDGSFIAADAKEILLNVIDYKIRFHQLKDFSGEERFGCEYEHSTERIAELRETRQEIIELFDNLTDLNEPIHLNSVINAQIPE